MDTITIDTEYNDDWIRRLPGYERERETIEKVGRMRLSMRKKSRNYRAKMTIKWKEMDNNGQISG